MGDFLKNLEDVLRSTHAKRNAVDMINNRSNLLHNDEKGWMNINQCESTNINGFDYMMNNMRINSNLDKYVYYKYNAWPMIFKRLK